jgi:hypothetical protein
MVDECCTRYNGDDINWLLTGMASNVMKYHGGSANRCAVWVMSRSTWDTGVTTDVCNYIDTHFYYVESIKVKDLVKIEILGEPNLLSKPLVEHIRTLK